MVWHKIWLNTQETSRSLARSLSLRLQRWVIWFIVSWNLRRTRNTTAGFVGFPEIPHLPSSPHVPYSSSSPVLLLIFSIFPKGSNSIPVSTAPPPSSFLSTPLVAFKALTSLISPWELTTKTNSRGRTLVRSLPARSLSSPSLSVLPDSSALLEFHSFYQKQAVCLRTGGFSQDGISVTSTTPSLDPQTGLPIKLQQCMGLCLYKPGMDFMFCTSFLSLNG